MHCSIYFFYSFVYQKLTKLSKHTVNNRCVNVHRKWSQLVVVNDDSANALKLLHFAEIIVE